MAMPFCGPVKPRPPVKNSAAVALRLLARMTTTIVTTTNRLKMPMLAAVLPTVSVWASRVVI